MSGIVGIIGSSEVATQLYDSLIQLQHRGQDAAGITTCDQRFHFKTGLGFVRDIFLERHIKRLSGTMGIGHTRYSTNGDAKNSDSIQPFWNSAPFGISFAHSGAIVNVKTLTEMVINQRRRYLNTSTCSEVLMQLFSSSLETGLITDAKRPFFDIVTESVAELMQLAQGSYSVISIIKDKGLVAFRDPHGITPLVLGERQGPDGTSEYIVSSENTMFYMLGYTLLRDIHPSEVVFIEPDGTLHSTIIGKKEFNPCIFEYVYYSRPDAMENSISVYRSRLRMGENLGKRWKQQYGDLRPDVIIPAPATANTMALAMAKELQTNYSDGLYKNPFIGRTFLMPDQQQRSQSVRYKLVPQQLEIRNKTVMIVDDSIVRGTTSREIVSMVRNFGAKGVYFVSACPPVIQPCFYGIDIPSKETLIAANNTVEQIRNYLQADILFFQDLEDLIEAVTRKGEHNIDMPCHACLGGPYCQGGPK